MVKFGWVRATDARQGPILADGTISSHSRFMAGDYYSVGSKSTKQQFRMQMFRITVVTKTMLLCSNYHDVRASNCREFRVLADSSRS
jgi:hypothetical protein